MIKLPKRVKLNDLGMTLVEIVVAIAIIGIVAVPLMNFFVMGMRVNQNASETEAAQNVAKDISEAFESVDLNDYFAKLNSSSEITVGEYTFSTSCVGVRDDDGNCKTYKLTLKNDVKGNYKDTYSVNVMLDAVSDKSDLPVIKDIGIGTNNVKRICEEYYALDGNVEEHLDAFNCVKTSTFNIKCTHTEEKKYQYSIDMDIAYGTKVYQDVKKFEFSIDDDGTNGLELFLLCNYFDTTTALSKDKIVINYEYVGLTATDTDEITSKVYLMGQNITSGGHSVSFQPSNITIDKNGYSGLKVYTNVAGVAGAEAGQVGSREVYNVYQLTVTAIGADKGYEGKVSTGITR